MRSGKKFTNLLLHRLIVALALDVKDDVSVLVDQIPIGPDIGMVGTPNRALQVRYYRPGQLKALGRVADIFGVVSHRKFAEMYAHNVKAIRMIFGVPALQNT